jgi:hypothetical protein
VRNVASVAVMTLVLGSVRLAIAQDYQALVSRFEPATSWSAASQPDLKGFGPIEIRKIIKLLDHSDEFIRSRSAMALGSMGPAASAAVPRLILGLEDRNLEVRVTMADALQAIDRAAAVSALVAALRDEDPAVFTDRVLFSFRIRERPRAHGGPAIPSGHRAKECSQGARDDRPVRQANRSCAAPGAQGPRRRGPGRRRNGLDED